jgi:hypothetical protein
MDQGAFAKSGMPARLADRPRGTTGGSGYGSAAMTTVAPPVNRTTSCVLFAPLSRV